MKHLIELIGRLFELVETGDRNMPNFFDDQRRAIPRRYGDLHKVTQASHAGIEAVKKGQSINAHRLTILETLDSMADANVPENESNQPRFEAEQEAVELFLFDVFYGFYIGGLHDISKVNLEDLTFEALRVSPQAWLFGLIDAVTELSKAIRDDMNKRQFTIDEKRDCLEDQIEFLLAVEGHLDRYTSIPPGVIGAYTRRGWMNTFRGKLGRLNDLIDRLKDRLSSLVDMIDFRDERKQG